MKNKIFLDEIQCNDSRIEYRYRVEGAIQKFFTPQPFFIEYSEKIDEVPKSILIIPFLCNILPIVWLTNTELYFDEVDQTFYDNIDEFKKGYIQMYPNFTFLGNLFPKKVVDNTYQPQSKSACFFSGGVDAFNTLLMHMEEKPTLITLWGSDIFFDDIVGWNHVKEHVINTATQFSCDTLFIKSNFRGILDMTNLGRLIKKGCNDNWWHGFQHGIGLIGHIAPYAYKHQLKQTYIASSYSEKDKGKYTCASDPTIDNYVKIASCNVIHDGYEKSRQDKIHFICETLKKQNKTINLRVCYQSSGGTNCCHCEKCYRTITAILAERSDPNKFGLHYDASIGKQIEIDMKKHILLDQIIVPFWQDIQKRMLENEVYMKNYPELQWMQCYDFTKINYTLKKQLRLGYYHFKKSIAKIIYGGR